MAGEEIRSADDRHKYDSAMAEFLDTIGADYEDESTGDVEWAEYVQRFGKRLLFTDDRGFVSCERFATVDLARARFDEIETAYNEWSREPEDEDYLITDRPMGSFDVAIVNGSFVGSFESRDGAVAAIRARMAHENFYPSVWFEDDHGGLEPVDVVSDPDEDEVLLRCDKCGTVSGPWRGINGLYCPSCDSPNVRPVDEDEHEDDEDDEDEYDDELDEMSARRLASEWHGGQSSPLYAFASSGTITDGLIREIDETLEQVARTGSDDGSQRAELERLKNWVRDHDEDETADEDEPEHVHVWGEPTRSRLAGTLHRPCTGCSFITLDLDDEDEDDET
jgi:hypothetical protein